MFIPDMPNVPPQNVPVMIAQANQAQQGDVTTIRTLGVCSPVPNAMYSLENVVEPIGEAQAYFRMYEHQTVTGHATITILQQPKNGILRLVTQADVGTILQGDTGTIRPDAGLYFYLPENGYLGKDKAIILVDFGNGLKVKVIFFFQAIEGQLGNTGLENYCSKTGTDWKISSTLDANGTNTITSVEYQSPATSAADATNTNVAALASWINSTDLNGNTAGITVNVADLAGAAIGQDTGTTSPLTLLLRAMAGISIPTPPTTASFFPPPTSAKETLQ
jgi:hypothetical protein